jgi:hypothetical protein
LGGVEYSVKQIRQDLIGATNELQDFIDLTQTQVSLRRLQLPSVVDAIGITQDELNTVLGMAKEDFSEEFAAGVASGLNEGINESDVTASFEPFLVDLGDELGIQLVRGVRQSDFSDALKQATEEGVISGLEDASRSGILKDFRDLTGAEFQAYAAQSMQAMNALNAAFPSLDLQQDDVVAATSTGFEQANANLMIMQMLMRDLIDVNEKQLEGVYNLPADASFYVPFTGYALGQGQGGGGAGSFADLIAALSGLQASTDNLARAVDKETVDRVKTLRQEQLTKYRYGEGLTADEMSAKELADSVKELRESQVEMYRYGKGFGYQQDEKSTWQTIVEDITSLVHTSDEMFGNMLSLLRNPVEYFQNFFAGGDTTKPTGDLKSLDKTLDALKKPIETSLSLDITSTTTLQVDGQTLADIVKNYLYEDLISQEDRSATVTQSVVI